MSPDPTPSVLSRRGLRFSAIAAAVLAVIIVVTGITTRRMADARLSEWTETPGGARGRRRDAGHPRQAHHDRTSRPARSLFAGADLCARERLSQGVEGRYRHAGQNRCSFSPKSTRRTSTSRSCKPRPRVASAQANLVLSRATLERGHSLIVSGSVSKQDIDQRQADFANKQGLLRSAQANLRSPQGPRNIQTHHRAVRRSGHRAHHRRRYADQRRRRRGAALFVVSDTSRLRAYVNVPQNYVPSIKIGTKAQISVPEYPGRNFPATVEASSQSVDVASGTTRMLLVVDNANGRI